MGDFLESLAPIISNHVPELLGAAAVLAFGWLLAYFSSQGLGLLLVKSGLERRIKVWKSAKGNPYLTKDRLTGSIYYFFILCSFIVFFEVINISILKDPLNELLTKAFIQTPHLFTPIALLLCAWVIAHILRAILTEFLHGKKVDQEVKKQIGSEDQISLSTTLGEVVYWSTFLIFAPSILDSLALTSMSDPIKQVLNRAMGFIPNLTGAVLIFAVGWFFARVIQRLTTNLLFASGADRLSERVGLSTILGKQKLSGSVGLVVYGLVLIPVFIASLNALALDAITKPASEMLTSVLNAIPRLFAASLLMISAYIGGKIVSQLLKNFLDGVGFNPVLHSWGVTKGSDGKKPSEIAASLCLFAILLFAVVESFGLLQFSHMAELTSEFIIFLGHLGVGVVIFGAGLWASHFVGEKVKSVAKNESKLLSTGARVAILFLTGAMALRQMGLANEIIQLAFGAIVGAFAVAFAIAFGLGGRDIAAKFLHEWSERFKAHDANFQEFSAEAKKYKERKT